MSFTSKLVLAPLLALVVIGGALTIAPAEARGAVLETIGMSAESIQDGSSPLHKLLGAGASEEATAERAGRDAAVEAGVPLLEAGLSPEDYQSLASQGSNVVVSCADIGRDDIATINSALAEAPGATLIPCGAFSETAPELAL